MNKNFYNILNGLNDPGKISASKIIMNKVSEEVATNANFFKNDVEMKRISESLYDIIDTTDIYLEHLIKLESKSPFGIFKFIIDGHDFSDIMIHKDGYKLTNNLEEEIVEIPEELLSVYRMFLDHLINLTKFISSKKFDTGNAIVDAEISENRLNLIHETLIKDSRYPIIVMRKKTNNNKNTKIDNYIDSIGVSDEQLKVINEVSLSGNYIIFGEVGSGKTTLLNYMGNKDLELKRNLITIEDTAELNIPVQIALLTNNKYKIKDLFTAALRQNPSHIITGETRTDEIVDILETALASNIGTTIHANSLARAIQRIIFMSMPRNIDPEIIKGLITASIDTFIFMENRKVKELWVHEDNISSDISKSYRKVN